LQRAGGGAAENRIYVTEFCYVKQEAPDTAFGYPDTALYRADFDASQYAHPVFKFKNQLSSVITENAVLTLGRTNDGIHWTRENSGTPIDFHFILYAILEDFDPSTLTYNQLIALSSTNLGNVARVLVTTGIGSGSYSAKNWAEPIPLAQGPGLNLSSNIVRGLFSEQAYGFWFQGDFGGGGPNWTVELDVSRVLLQADSEKYSAWIDWF